MEVRETVKLSNDCKANQLEGEREKHTILRYAGYTRKVG